MAGGGAADFLEEEGEGVEVALLSEGLVAFLASWPHSKFLGSAPVLNISLISGKGLKWSMDLAFM